MTTTTSDNPFTPFFFDGNQWSGTVDSVETWRRMVSIYTNIDPGCRSSLDQIMDTKMAPVMEIDELPKNYHMGSMGVRSGDLRSFGWRREHMPGTVTLEEWAKNRGMDLRKLAEERPQA